jgi:hypothetical protein
VAIQRRKSADLARVLKQNDRGRLLPPVERFLAAEPRDPRRADILHPSALSKKDVCPRAAYMSITNNRLPEIKVGFQLQRIFDEGHLIHDKWQRYFRRMGVLYGKWKCLECGCISPEMILPPSGCGTCGGDVKYAEVPLEVPQWIVAGHADGWIKGIGDDVLIEIKSVGSGTVRIEDPVLFEKYSGNIEELWKNIRRPFPAHINQAQFYLAMAEEMGLDFPKEIVFIYEFKYNQSAKEFVVPYSRAHVQEIIDFCLMIRAAVDAGTPPKCPTYNCKQCKEWNDD